MKLIIDIPEEEYKMRLLWAKSDNLCSPDTMWIARGVPYKERPQGKWIFDSEFTEFGNPYGTYKCDKCGGHSSNKYPFCFWCGADMEGGAE